MTLAELAIKITCDTKDAEKGITQTEKKTSKLSTAMGKVSNGVKKAGKVIGTALGASAVAIGKLGTDIVKAYAQYEQLTGGVETLFGTSAKSIEEYQKQIGINEKSTQKEIDASVKKYESLTKAQETIMKNAHEAFRTAGMDANTYMETVTSFSASLIQGLHGDTLKAAEYANRAIVDMSDNANKMGTSIESIQNAYQGFAKQNYTMLDNLKLGYGGTKSEMERLIKDAASLTDVQKELGITVDKNSLSFDNIVNAISVMQKSMGIAETTANEAATTISGSFGMMKGAWENLKIAMVSPDGNIQQALDDFLASAKTFGINVIPVFSNALKGIATTFKELAPVIAQELPWLVNELLPDLISAAVELVGGLTKAIIDNAHMIIDGFGQILKKIGEVLENSDNPVLQAAGKLMNFLGDLFRDPMGTLEKAWNTVWTGITQVASDLWEGIKSTANTVWEAIKGFWTENIENPVKSAWEAVSNAFSTAWEWIKTTAGNVWEAIKTWWTENIATPVSDAWNAVTKAFSDAWSWIESLADTVWSAIKNFWEENIEGPVRTAWNAVSEAFSSIWETIKTTASNVWEAIKGFWTENISGPLSKVWETVKSKVSGIWDSIKTTAQNVWESMKTTAETVWNAIKGVAETVWNAIKDFIKNPIKAVSIWLSNIWEGIKLTASIVWNAIKSTAESIWNGIKSFIEDPINTVATTLGNIWKSIKETAETAWNAVKDALDPIIRPIRDLIQGVIDKVKGVIDWFKRLMGFDGQNLSSTTSTHTAYETTVKRTVTYNEVKNGTVTLPKATADDPYPGLTTGVSGFNPFKNAKGDWSVPYDDFPALLHRNEMVLTASQARRYRDGETGVDLSGLGTVIVEAIREGMANAQVNSYLDGRKVTEEVNRITGNSLMARRYAP